MADTAAPSLTAATLPLDGTEIVYVVQGSNSRRATAADLLKLKISATDQAAARASISAALKGHINGLALSTNVTDATNDIDIAAGEVASAQASPLLMVYAGATGRQIDVAYGTGSGARFDSAVSDGTWYIFVISNGTTVALGLSKFADPTGQANFPSGYTHYQAIGYVVRASSANKAPVMFAKPTIEVVGVAPVFGCRAWANFDGQTGTMRSSGNVSSVTRNGTGDYTINFAVPMPDANYVLAGTGQAVGSGNGQTVINYAATSATGSPLLKSASQCRIIVTLGSTGSPTDFAHVGFMVVG